MYSITSHIKKLAVVKNWFLKLSIIKKILVFVFIGSIIWFGKPLMVKGEQQKLQYQTTAAEKGTLIESITASGSVTATNSSPVTTNVSGVVEEVYVKNGDFIEAGKPLAKLSLDQDSLQTQSTAYASYLSASNAVQSAQQSKDSADVTMWSASQGVLNAQNDVNVKNDNTVNATTKQDYTDLEKQSIDAGLVEAQKSFSANEKKYLQADSAITSAKAQLNSAWLAYQKTLPNILAPISGTVSDLSLQTGTLISGSTSSTTSSSTTSSSSSSSSQKVATIKTDGSPTVSINLTEIDVPKLKIGNRATVTFDAFPDKTYTGKIFSIDTTGTVSSGVTTYAAVITLDTVPTNLYSNMSASASVITNTKSDVILVPSGAVTTADNQSTVKVLKNGQVQQLSVQVGLTNDTQTEIVSGISEGDMVVTGQTGGATIGKTNTATSPFGGSTRTGFGGAGLGGGGATIRRPN